MKANPFEGGRREGPRVSLSIPEVRAASGGARGGGPIRRADPGAGAERSQFLAPSEANPRRRAKPIPRAERSQSPRRPKPIPRASGPGACAERTVMTLGRVAPPHERPGRCLYACRGRAGSFRGTRASAFRSPLCGSVRLPTRGRGARRGIGRRPDCQRTSLHYRNPRPPRSPNPRPGVERAGPPGTDGFRNREGHPRAQTSRQGRFVLDGSASLPLPPLGGG